MNILVIGNGFDLAHGLPTKYGDFLQFVKVINQVVEVNNQQDWEAVHWSGLHPEIIRFIIEVVDSKRENWSVVEKWRELIKDNFWFKYFDQCDMHGNENWIDFESEIAQVIESITDRMERDGYNLYSLEPCIKKKYLNEYESKYKVVMKIIDNLTENKNEIRFIDMRNMLEKDLNRLIRALEWYLCEYIDKMEIRMKSNDIDSINADCVLSFNYTNTFSRLYQVKQKIGEKDADLFDYIHGVADINKELEDNNMVLGIDEYLSDDRKNKDVEFIIFKKYYQRIFKGTGCKYKDWTDEIKESRKTTEIGLRDEYPAQIPFQKFTSRHYIYIFGHSLDVTDKDIMKDLILNDNVYTIIYYYNKNDLSSKIANLVKVIGQDELIRRTGGSTKTIEFKLQKDMAKI